MTPHRPNPLFLALSCAATLSCAAPEPKPRRLASNDSPDVTYTLDLRAPDHVRVTLRAVDAAASGGFRVPIDWEGRGGLDENIVIDEVLDSAGRPVRHSIERWTLRGEGDGALTVRYQVATRGTLDVETEGYPILSGDYFLSTGHPLFLYPEVWVESGEGQYRVEIIVPEGWDLHTTAGTQSRIDRDGLAALRELVIAAGDFRRAGESEGDGAPALVVRGKWQWQDGDLLRPARAIFRESRAIVAELSSERHTIFLAPWPQAKRRTAHVLLDALEIVAGRQFDPGEPDTVSFLASSMARARIDGALRREGHSFFDTLWFRDGLAAYYGLVLPIRAGQAPAEGALDRLQESVVNDHRREAIPDLRVYDLKRWYHWDERVVRSVALKGALLAFLLDVRMRAAQKSLDGWLDHLNERMGGQKKRYSAADLASEAGEYLGEDLGEFFEQHVNGVEALPVERWLRDAGFSVSSQPEEYPDFGFAMRVDDGQLRLHDVRQGGAAHRNGLRESDLVRDWYLPVGRFDLPAWVRVARSDGEKTIRFSPDRARRDVLQLSAQDPKAAAIVRGIVASKAR